MHPNQIATIRRIAETSIAMGLVGNHITVDQLVEHMIFVKEVSLEGDVELDWEKFPLGTSRETLMAAAEAKARAKKRSAGARALKKKYGKEAAERIIEKKTGKHINLRG